MMKRPEIEVAYDGPAPAANRACFVMAPNGIRLAFLEQLPVVDSEVVFRSGVFLSFADAEALADLIKSSVSSNGKTLS